MFAARRTRKTLDGCESACDFSFRKSHLLKFAANLTMLFNELEFQDRFAAAAKTKFNAVEFLAVAR
jgi:hypothetical protein